MLNKYASAFIDQVDKQGVECSVRTIRGTDGGIIRYECVTGSDEDHFFKLTEEERKKAMVWLRYNLIPAEKPLYGHTSYGMKHILERRLNLYMTNNQFKEAMLAVGFFPSKVDELNWNFCVRKSSPMFQRQIDDQFGMPMMGEPMKYERRAAEDNCQ